MTAQKSLLLGAGNSRAKRYAYASAPGWAGDLVTIDMNPGCGVDVVWDLENRPLPFDDDTFDEMGAFDVLEHIGKCGDWRGFFDEFAEYWRIMKPGGRFFIIVPVGRDHFADPGHTRFFSLNFFGFLDQRFYAEGLAKGQPLTDYRWYWKHSFEIEHHEAADHHLGVILRKA